MLLCKTDPQAEIRELRKLAKCQAAEGSRLTILVRLANKSKRSILALALPLFARCLSIA